MSTMVSCFRCKYILPYSWKPCPVCGTNNKLYNFICGVDHIVAKMYDKKNLRIFKKHQNILKKEKELNEEHRKVIDFISIFYDKALNKDKSDV